MCKKPWQEAREHLERGHLLAKTWHWQSMTYENALAACEVRRDEAERRAVEAEALLEEQRARLHREKHESRSERETLQARMAVAVEARRQAVEVALELERRCKLAEAEAQQATLRAQELARVAVLAQSDSRGKLPLPFPVSPASRAGALPLRQPGFK